MIESSDFSELVGQDQSDLDSVAGIRGSGQVIFKVSGRDDYYGDPLKVTSLTSDVKEEVTYTKFFGLDNFGTTDSNDAGVRSNGAPVAIDFTFPGVFLLNGATDVGVDLNDIFISFNEFLVTEGVVASDSVSSAPTLPTGAIVTFSGDDIKIDLTGADIELEPGKSYTITVRSNVASKASDNRTLGADESFTFQVEDLKVTDLLISKTVTQRDSSTASASAVAWAYVAQVKFNAPITTPDTLSSNGTASATDTVIKLEGIRVGGTTYEAITGGVYILDTPSNRTLTLAVGDKDVITSTSNSVGISTFSTANNTTNPDGVGKNYNQFKITVGGGVTAYYGGSSVANSEYAKTIEFTLDNLTAAPTGDSGTISYSPSSISSFGGFAASEQRSLF